MRKKQRRILESRLQDLEAGFHWRPAVSPEPSGLTDKDIKYLKWCESGAKLFSTCGKRQYMAIAVDSYGRVCSTGYNGAPPGMKHCIDGGCPRWQENLPPGSNYDTCIAAHAEENCLILADPNRLRGATLYVNGPPCFGCAKKIAVSHVKRVVHLEDSSYADWPRVLKFLLQAGIIVEAG